MAILGISGSWGKYPSLADLQKILRTPHLKFPRESTGGLKALLSTGQMAAGQVLVAHGYVNLARAGVRGDGRVMVDGKEYADLDEAASVAWINAHGTDPGLIDGWKFWHIRRHDGHFIEVAQIVPMKPSVQPSKKNPSDGQAKSPTSSGRRTRPDRHNSLLLKGSGRRALEALLAPVANQPAASRPSRQPLRIHDAWPDPSTIDPAAEPGKPPYRVMLYDSDGAAMVDRTFKNYRDAMEHVWHIKKRGSDEKVSIVDSANHPM